MASQFPPKRPKTPEITDKDVDMMARVLERRHGKRAIAIADYFALEHVLAGDKGRSQAWTKVATKLRDKAAILRSLSS